MRGTSQRTARAIALALPGAEEGSHFGHADVRVAKKIFASFPGPANAICLRTTPANLDALRARRPEIFRDAWSGRWVEVRIDRVSRAELTALVADAWRLVAPRRMTASPVARSAKKKPGSR